MNFLPSGLAKMALERAVGRATGNVTSQIQEAVGGVTMSSEKKIDWTVYNWPMKHEFLGLLHFDLEELKTKRSEQMHALILLQYRWWLALLAMFALNFITTIALMAGVGSPAYSSLALLFWLIELALGASLGMFFVYKSYHGWAENSGRSKTFARGTMALLLVLLVIPIFVFGGNLNGFSGYASGAFATASASGVADGMIGFWKAVIAIESLAWMGLEGFLGFCFYKAMTE